MTRVESWSGTRIGTLVTLRRGALTGEKIERTKAWTASGPYFSESGVACIRVDIGGAVVSYPLDRVSLGWEEPVAVVPLATVLDPVPETWTVTDRFAFALVAASLVYFVAVGGMAIIAWVLR